MKHVDMTEALYDFMVDASVNMHPVLKKIQQKTKALPLANMQIAPEQGQFIQFLLKSIHAKKVLELGTFTGYSALAMALALPDDGQVITCDINDEWTSMAKPLWDECEAGKKINLKLGPALESLYSLINDGHDGSFDFIFIDADKTSYVDYYELSLKLIKQDGIIAIDNIFWDGQVVDASDDSAQTREIRRLVTHIKHDKRVMTSLLPIADGLFLIRKQ